MSRPPAKASDATQVDVEPHNPPSFPGARHENSGRASKFPGEIGSFFQRRFASGSWMSQEDGRTSDVYSVP